MFINSKSLISIISVLSRCLTMRRHIASRSRLFSMPIRCNELSLSRSSARPVISCCKMQNDRIKLLQDKGEASYYLHKQLGIHGIVVTMSFIPLLYIGNRPQTHWLRSGICFCLQIESKIVVGMCFECILLFRFNFQTWPNCDACSNSFSYIGVVVASIRRRAFHSRENKTSVFGGEMELVKF